MSPLHILGTTMCSWVAGTGGYSLGTPPRHGSRNAWETVVLYSEGCDRRDKGTGWWDRWDEHSCLAISYYLAGALATPRSGGMAYRRHAGARFVPRLYSCLRLQRSHTRPSRLDGCSRRCSLRVGIRA